MQHTNERYLLCATWLKDIAIIACLLSSAKINQIMLKGTAEIIQNNESFFPIAN